MIFYELYNEHSNFAENLNELLANKNTSKGSWFIAIKLDLNKLVCFSQENAYHSLISEVKNTQHLPKVSIGRLFFL
jgi:hypothetical protein